ncbi:uncharacterized protein LOC131951955 [Physella acuta]|uniref:uncharacterized protein LOC131951955 n=1 Tax=Physella acuta TaxID=109671 RepID=UPI0027DBAC86|nr:uncharacterized protein LOC131951955 [Physella acuta]
MISLAVSILCAAVAAAPAVNESWKFSTAPLAKQDYDFLSTLPQSRAGAQLPGFKYIYVEAGGQKTNVLDHSRYQLEIAGSPGTTYNAINAAADFVIKMTKHMSGTLFQSVATQSSLGIFSAREKLIVFPEYKHLANGNCGTSCEGTCSHTCTFDGRKYEDIAGVGGRRAVILDDNVLCTALDPYHHNLNVLSHEYTHTIHQYSLDAASKHQITTAYNSARQAQRWDLHSYAMADEKEYFAVGASVFFGVNKNGRENSGGMNICGSGYCVSETQARAHLQSGDSLLYAALSHVFTADRPSLTSSLTICPVSSVIG